MACRAVPLLAAGRVSALRTSPGQSANPGLCQHQRPRPRTDLVHLDARVGERTAYRAARRNVLDWPSAIRTTRPRQGSAVPPEQPPWLRVRFARARGVRVERADSRARDAPARRDAHPEVPTSVVEGVHCVETEVQLRDFVIRALEERLAKGSRRTRKPRAPERR